MPILNADYLTVAVKAFRSSIHVALQSENLEALIVFAMAQHYKALPARGAPNIANHIFLKSFYKSLFDEQSIS